MKSLGKNKGPGEPGVDREPARKRFSRWFAPVLAACSICLSSGCFPRGEVYGKTDSGSFDAGHRDAGRNDAGAHDAGIADASVPPECQTEHADRVLPSAIQHTEMTLCASGLETEVSSFEPPLDGAYGRNIVRFLQGEKILLFCGSDIVAVADETSDNRVRAGESADIIGYHVHMGEVADQMVYSLETLSISSPAVRIAIKDTHYAVDGLTGPTDLSAEHDGWYALNVLAGRWVYLKLYGISFAEPESPVADIGAVTMPVVLYQGTKIEGPSGGFVFQSTFADGKLTGWTLTRDD
ncbi:MAG: hypothetical protein V1827_06375 [Candidatus Micrarchaeota archaeon]